MAGKRQPQTSTVASSYLTDLQAKLGTTSGSDPTAISDQLLWLATVGLLKRGVTMSLGTNKARTQYIVTLWDGDFPFKSYCDGEEDLNRKLAAIARSYWKADLPPEWEQAIQAAGY